MMTRRPRTSITTAALLAAVALAVLPILSGCGTAPAGSPRQIAGKAIKAQERLKSVRIRLESEVEREGPSGQPITNTYLGEGYYEKPDRSKMTITSVSGKTQVVAIGDSTFVKMPGSSAWSKRLTGEDASRGFAPGSVSEYLKYTKGLQLVDRKGDTYHLRFKMDMTRYVGAAKTADVDPAVFKGTQTTMDVWILKDDFYVKRAKMSFSGDLSRIGAGKLKMTVDVEFSEFNEPVSIEAPM